METPGNFARVYNRSKQLVSEEACVETLQIMRSSADVRLHLCNDLGVIAIKHRKSEEQFALEMRD